MEKKALGKGLGALLPESLPKILPIERETSQDVPLDRIVPNRFQPRHMFETSELAQLAESITRNGVLQPVLVRRKGDGLFELIAGERRYRAARLAGLKSIPAVVRNTSDEQSMELALVENLQREDLNPIEEARAYHRLTTEFGLTQEALAQKVGKDRSSVANSLRLLNLPNEIKELVESLKISMGHAKVLLGLSRLELQLKLAKQIVEGQLSVRQAEQLVASGLRPTHSKPGTRRLAAYPDLEEQLRKRLGTKVLIHKGRKGGRIEIHYFEPADLNRLIDMILV
ncbi:MAG: ParB/RepB/Spo0J family partition protein [Nitrospiraceae bacterium]